MTATARYVVRSALTGLAGAATSLLTAMPGLTADDLITAALLGILAGLGYAGIGAASRNVEPDVGRTG